MVLCKQQLFKAAYVQVAAEKLSLYTRRDVLESRRNKMEVGSKALQAFLERLNAHPNVGSKELGRIGRYLGGPLDHPCQISSRRLPFPPLDLFVSDEGLWTHHLGEPKKVDLKLNDASHVITSPHGETVTLENEQYKHNIDRVKIHGIVDGKPVTSVGTECTHSLDQGLDRTHLFLGSVLVTDNGIIYRRVYVHNKDVYFFYWSKTRDVYSKIVRLRNGQIEDVWDMPKGADSRSEIFVTDDEIVLYGDNPVQSISAKMLTILDRSNLQHKTRTIDPAIVQDGNLVVNAYHAKERIDHPDAQYWELVKYRRIKPGQFAWRSKVKDGLHAWTLNSNQKHQNGTDLIVWGPSFDVISNLFQVDGEWCYYAAIGTMLYKMRLHL